LGGRITSRANFRKDNAAFAAARPERSLPAVRVTASAARRVNLNWLSPLRKPNCPVFSSLLWEVTSCSSVERSAVVFLESFLALRARAFRVKLRSRRCSGRHQRFWTFFLEGALEVLSSPKEANTSFLPFTLIFLNKFTLALPEIFLSKAKLRRSEVW